MTDSKPETTREHAAQIQCDLADLHALLIMCATGCEGEEPSRVMNAAGVLTKRIHDRATLVWNQLRDDAAATNGI